MSINLLLGNALSGIQTNQSALQQVSNNIANVNTPNYARRVVHQEAVSLEGQAAGVSISEVKRIVDRFFSTQSIASMSDEARYEAEARIHNRIQALLGDPAGGNTLADRLNTVLGSAADALIDPASGVRRATILSDLEAMTLSFTQMADEIQTIRGEVDGQISETVGRINEALERITDLNQQIQKQVFQGDTSTSLKDQRDSELSVLAELIDIRVSEQSDGTVLVTTGDGFALVGSGLTTLSYDNVSASTARSIYPQITVTRATSTGIQSGYVDALDSHVGGGALKGLMRMRDNELPQFAEQVGELASAIVDGINAVHNDSAAVPPPSTLTGRNTGLAGSDPIGFTGRTSVVIVDSNGALVDRIDVDFDTGTYSANGGPAASIGSTIADFATVMNGVLGGGLNVTFTNGVMSFEATGGNGVAFLQDSAVPSDRGGRGFSHFFGLNDLLTAERSSHFATGLSAAESHHFTTGQTAEFRVFEPGGSVAEDITITIDVSWSNIGAVITGLNNTATGLGQYYTFTLDANGQVIQTPKPGYDGYDLQAGPDSTDRAGTGVSLTDLFGIGGAAQAEQARNMAIRSDIAVEPNYLSFAKVDLSGSPAAGDTVLSQSDNRGAQALQQLSGANVDFEQAGHLSATKTTLASYAGMVVADVSNRAAIADSRQAQATTFREEVTARRDEVQGVNLDEELSNMIIYQQAYNASARMLSTAQELYDTLLRLV